MPNTFVNAKDADLTTSLATLYTAPTSSSNVAIVLGVCIANKNAASRTITLEWQDASDSSAATQLLSGVTIPGNSTLEILEGAKIILMASDVLRSKASAASSLDITVSLMEVT